MPAPASNHAPRARLRPWQVALNRFFNRASVEISIGVLVIISVLLTLLEFWLETQLAQSGAAQLPWGTWGPFELQVVIWINEAITGLFATELTLRFLAASSKRVFFSEFWLDILATVPVFRVFRFSRALRLLRVIRLLRLLGIFSRLANHYPTIFRKSAVDFVIICGMLVVAIGFGTLAITHFENTRQPWRGGAVAPQVLETDVAAAAQDEGEGYDLESSFWFSVYTLLSGEPIPGPPRTLYSKIVTVGLMFMGMTIFAIFAGTVSAFMVDRMRREGKVVEWDALNDHIVICGWTPKTRVIIEEYRSSPDTRRTPIVVISELDRATLEEDVADFPSVMLIQDDFTRVSALERAGIARARTCLVLSDTTGGRSPQDADARTILAALTVEKINPDVYTCAELVNRDHASHLKVGNVNDFVVSGEYGAHILAQAAMKQGLASVVSELLTYQRGNEFFRVPIPASWVGATFDEKLIELRRTQQVILVAVHADGQAPVINPSAHTFGPQDQIVVIGHAAPKLS